MLTSSCTRFWDVHSFIFCARAGYRVSANCYYMNYFPGYGEVNVRVYIEGWHQQVMQLYPSVVWERILEVYWFIVRRG